MKGPRIALLILALALPLPALAQGQGGSIYGVAQDEQGAMLPGVVLTLTGPDRTMSFTTDKSGEYRFLNLQPGLYTLKAMLSGFATMIHEHVTVAVGTNVSLPITLKIATFEQTVTVTSEAPIVDPKAMGTATSITQIELANIPTSRDPWALLRTIPGVLVDRVNIAGNETGQQSNIQAKGTRPQDAVWTMDGVVITDMAAVGASPTYFNYDNFDEIQISTTGQDIRQPTGGLGLNFVVKRGTNQLKGTVRGFFNNDRFDWSNIPDELRAVGVTDATADHNIQIGDFGAELGGPIVKDRAWFYGSYSDQDIRVYRRSTGRPDLTKLKTGNVKGSWQITQQNLFNVLWFLGEKSKQGRSPGTSGITFDAQTATWNQVGSYVDNRPQGLLKFEDNHVFSNSFFVNGRYAYYNTGFGLVPVGGLGQEAGESRFLAQSFGSTQQSLNIRPQHTVNVDANYFASAGGMSHQVKAGGGYRRSDFISNTLWPGNMIRAMENSATDLRARLYREGFGTDRVEFAHVYLGDTITYDRMTLDVGVRYDRQWGGSLPSNALGNAAFPDVVPGIQFAGYRAPFTWNDVSPRAGVTYALDDSRKTILRASYSRYAGQLETSIVGWSNPSASAGFAEYRWVDLNGDHFAQPGEVLLDQFLSNGGGFNPDDPTSVVSADKIDPDLKAPITTSVVAGIDREVMPNLAVSVNYSYTRTSNNNGNFTALYTPWIGHTAADFTAGPTVSGTLQDGTTFAYPSFLPSEAVVEANGFGRLLANWPGYRSYYHGVEATFMKRMSNHWMARVSVAYNDARETYGSLGLSDLGNPTRTDTSPLVNDGQYVVRSGGSGSGDIFVSGRWQLSANAAYMLPYDFLVGVSVFGRQGYPYPVYVNADLGLDGAVRMLATPEIDTFRLNDLWDTDIRLSKTFKYSRLNAELIVDLFNVFNANTELVRNRNLESPSFQALSQNLSPRTARFGVRFGF